MVGVATRPHVEFKGVTVSYGMRWEVMPFSTTANPGDQSRYDFSNNTLLIGGYGSALVASIVVTIINWLIVHIAL